MRFLMSVLLALGLSGPAFAEARTIVVTGQGSVAAVPDEAVISLGVTYQATEARVAVVEVAVMAGEILNRLKELGIGQKDVRTSDLSLYPVRERSETQGQPKVVGFTASNTVTVKVRDITKIGAVLSQVVQDGANQFHGLQFGFQDPRPYQDEARRRAVADARSKAELYAAAAGVKLGPLLQLSEAGSNAPRPKMRGLAMEANMDMPVAAGELATQASVTLVYAIAD